MPARLIQNGYLAGFQNCELTSGSVAAPTSPIPAALASGAMVCEMTACSTGLKLLSLSSSAFATTAIAKTISKDSILDFLIFLYFLVCYT